MHFPIPVRSAMIAAICALAIVGGVAVWRASIGRGGLSPASRLAALSRQRTPPMPWPGGESYKHSAVFTSYEDLGYAPRPFLWEVAIWYSNCPVTRAGAFRLTLFANGRQYSRTLVDFRPSEKAVYTWPAREETTWKYHVEIPSGRGCAYWELGSVGN